MSSSSPFDDPTDEFDPPARRPARRPWWRWNIITLAVALFVLIWVRELFGLELGTIWLLALTLFVVWGLGPAFFVPNWMTNMAERADAEEGPRLQPWSGNLPLVVLKVLSVLLGAGSIVHLAIAMYAVLATEANSGGVFFNGMAGSLFQRLLQYSWVVVQPMTQFVAAATLFVLAEIALRLEKR